MTLGRDRILCIQSLSFSYIIVVYGVDDILSQK